MRPTLPPLFGLVLLLVQGCRPTAAPQAEPPVTTQPEPTQPEVAASFELQAPEAEPRVLSLSPEANMIACYHDPRPERGDYLWIRLAESREANGDAGPRLDIDVCRLGAIAGQLPAMPAGQHGSHCADTPGFAIWWHEDPAVFNTGPEGASGACELTLERDGDTLRGRFACAGLRQVEPEDGAGRELSLAAGSFACTLQPMPG